MKQLHSFTIFRNVALSYSELLMIIKSRCFYVFGHISNIFASPLAKTVFKLETVLTRDDRLPFSLYMAYISSLIFHESGLKTFSRVVIFAIEEKSITHFPNAKVAILPCTCTVLLVQWNLVIKRSDITKPCYNKVILLVPALYISLFFYPDIMRNLI